MCARRARRDDAVGDRANDAIRITGAELRCKVIGEGANLGMTQRGRIEAALAGGRLNTDAIDNSAGVNTSDLEVNIKIALSRPLRAGTLTHRRAQRAARRDDRRGRAPRAAQQLPADAGALLGAAARLEDLGFQQRLMQTLEQRGQLDRAVEFLPDEMAIAERRKRNLALTRPELAVLLAYAKLSLYSDLLDSSGARRSLSRPRTGALFPHGDVGALRRRAASPSPAARDHRHPARQLDDQSRRPDADRAHRRPDRRLGRRHRRRLRGGAQQLRPDRAQFRDRRARQQNLRRHAACALCRRAEFAARPPGLVPAQCRSEAGAGDRHRALP